MWLSCKLSVINHAENVIVLGGRERMWGVCEGELHDFGLEILVHINYL